jgi:hypothetical protein
MDRRKGLETACRKGSFMGGDVIEGFEEHGLVQKPARLFASRGRYFLLIDRVRKALPLEGGIVEADLRTAVGKEVTAVIAGTNIVAVLGPGRKKQRWTCYIPAPDLFGKMNKDVQRRILDRYVAEGVISRRVTEKLANVR